MPRVFYDYSGLGLTSMCKPSMASSNKTYKFPHPCEHKRTRGQARVLVWGRREGGGRAQEGAGKRRGRMPHLVLRPREGDVAGVERAQPDGRPPQMACLPGAP